MATSTPEPLEPETGPELCRVHLEDGKMGGYKNGIITENLSDREIMMYKCPRCNGIMKDASISNKGDPFCVCCTREGEEAIPNAFVRTTILSLKCVCPLTKRGCEWLGKIESVENHLTRCFYVYNTCQLLCGAVKIRVDLEYHVLYECIQRKQECEYCGVLYKVYEMIEHLEECGKKPIMCELGCGLVVVREVYTLHRKFICEEEIVKCPYEKYKCESEFKRKGLKLHLEEYKDAHIALKFSYLEENITELKRMNSSIVEELVTKDQELAVLREEVGILTRIALRKEEVITWVIENISVKFRSRPQGSFSRNSCAYEIALYQFNFRHSADERYFNIIFRSIIAPRTSIWPFKAAFITRIFSIMNPKKTLVFQSPLIEIQEREFSQPSEKFIAAIPLTQNLKDYTRSKNKLEVNITIRIFNV